MSKILSTLRRQLTEGDLIRALQWQYFANIAVGIIGAFYILLLGRTIGIHEFGLYSILVATPTLVSNCFDLRLQETVIYLQSTFEQRSSAKDGETLTSIIIIDILFRTVGLGASFAISIAVARYLNLSPGYSTLLMSSLVVFAAKAANSPSMGILRARGELDFFAKCQVSDWTARTLMLIALQQAGGLSLLTILGSQLCSAAFHNILVVSRATRILGAESSLIDGFACVGPTWRKHHSLLLNGQAISISDSAIKELDTIAVASLLSISSVGAYKMAKNFAAIAWRAADPVYIVILPRLARLCRNADKAALNAFLRTTTRALLGLGIVLYAGSVVAAHLGIAVMLGPEFAPSATVFPLAGAWILVGTPLIWTHSLAFAAGRPGLQTWASVIGNAGGLLAIYVGAWEFGLPGAALGLSVAYALPFMLAFLLIRSAGITR